MAELEFIVDENWEKWHKKNSWAVFIPAFARDEKGQGFMRNSLRGDLKIYKVVKKENSGRQEYRCNDCGSDVIFATVAHPINDNKFPLPGSSKFYDEDLPYCPKCEEKPEHSGVPITVA